MFISVGNAKIFTTSFGSKTSPAIIGIGGWIGSWELWAEPFSLLSETWQTIAFDHRGTGATLAPVNTITFDRLVDDVFAVLDAYAIERCVLAAESAGALTAFGAALQMPDRISGLVIVDGMYYPPPSPAQDPFLLGLQTAYSPTLNQFVDACIPQANSTHLKRWGRQIIDRASQEAALALYQMAGEHDLRDKLPDITQPALILHGAVDAIVQVEAARQLVNLLPQAKLVVLDGAGHVPTITHPEIIAEEITAFFN